MKIKHKSDADKRRKAEYPSVEAQLDALFHALKRLIATDPLMPKEAKDLVDAIQATKDKYPKAGQ